MNKKSLLSIALTLILVSINFNSVAADNILIIGGGGETEKPDTIFDDSLSNLGTFLNSSGKWEQNISFNHGHSKTEQILSSTFKTPNKPFTKDEYNNQIAALKLKIENSTKPGEQFLVYLDTHGAKNNGEEKTHSVSTNEGLINIDNLKELTDLAKTKNVKLAVLDFSCHSGNTMKLAENDDTTCFITASSPNNFSFTDFTSNFTSKMASGKNLEEVFIAARAATDSRGLPMINTPVGKMIQDKGLQIENSLFFDLNDPITKINKLDDYMRLKLKEDGSCKEFTPNQDLIDLITKAENMSTVTKRFLFWKFTTKDDFSLLKKSLKDYADFQNDLKKSYLKLKEVEDQKVSFTAPDGIQAYNLDELYNIDTNSMIDLYQNAVNNADTDYAKNFYRDYITMYQNVKLKQIAIKEDPETKRLFAIEAEIKTKSQSANALTITIAKQEREFYSSLYKSLQKEEAIKSAKNPCRDFVL